MFREFPPPALKMANPFLAPWHKLSILSPGYDTDKHIAGITEYIWVSWKSKMYLFTSSSKLKLKYDMDFHKKSVTEP